MAVIDLIVGARPNFMKVAALYQALRKRPAQGAFKDVTFRLIHTGQHYDYSMSAAFFDQLQIPAPDLNLNVGSGSQAAQTGAIMLGYEGALQKQKSNLCVVVGDVNSTMACAIVAKKMGVRVAHIEAGIRSGDWTMPEEINRLVTDSITDYFFTTSKWASANLRKSGIAKDQIFFVGNTMIDTLLSQQKNFQAPPLFTERALQPQNYFVATLHRPSNVDDPARLRRLLEVISESTRGLPVIFPVHPRTLKNLEGAPLPPNIFTSGPLPYLEFNYLVERAKMVLTDSGGITEETTVMRVPCLTLRNSTERPETVELGTNELIGTDPDRIPPAMERLFAGQWKQGSIPPKWDGKTGARILKHLEVLLPQLA